MVLVYRSALQTGDIDFSVVSNESPEKIRPTLSENL